MVPSLVGVEVIVAYKIALIAGVAIVGPNPDLPLPLRGVIGAQSPVAGTAVWSADEVTVLLRPTPDRAPTSAHPGWPSRKAATAVGRVG